VLEVALKSFLNSLSPEEFQQMQLFHVNALKKKTQNENSNMNSLNCSENSKVVHSNSPAIKKKNQKRHSGSNNDSSQKQAVIEKVI